jgi:hypothetical protein
MRTGLALLVMVGCGDNRVGTSTVPIEAADVSILYPLPDSRDQLIQPTEEAAYGVLFPEVWFPTAIGPVDIGVTYGDMRMVALRLDPCSARKSCNAEVRAIFQPVVTGGDGRPTVADGAIHVFYAMELDELLAFMTEIRELKRRYGAAIDYDSALGPQPILAATGLDGEFATELHALVLEHLGQSRIERFTERNHQIPAQDRWDFYLFEVDSGGNLVREFLPFTNADEQQVTGTPSDPATAGGIIAINPVLDTPVVAIVDNNRPAAATDAIRAGFAHALELQDPTKVTSESVDCVSCHLAEGGRRVGVSQYGLAPAGAFDGGDIAYERDLTAITDLHMFAYDGRAVSVSQRVANESAMTARIMQDLTK